MKNKKRVFWHFSIRKLWFLPVLKLKKKVKNNVHLNYLLPLVHVIFMSPKDLERALTAFAQYSDKSISVSKLIDPVYCLFIFA